MVDNDVPQLPESLQKFLIRIMIIIMRATINMTASLPEELHQNPLIAKFFNEDEYYKYIFNPSNPSNMPSRIIRAYSVNSTSSPLNIVGREASAGPSSESSGNQLNENSWEKILVDLKGLLNYELYERKLYIPTDKVTEETCANYIEKLDIVINIIKKNKNTLTFKTL